MKRKYFAAGLLILAGLVSWAVAPIPELSRNGFAMNTLIRISAHTTDESIIDDAYSLLHELDHRLSMYNPSSDISRVNSLAGTHSVNVSPHTLEAVRDSLRLYEATNGVFNVLIGPVTRLWKINAAEKSVPSPESLNAAIALTDITNLELGDSSILLKTKGCVIDLGGMAKGYASGKIAALLKSKGVTSGLVDLGGNIYTIGTKPDGENWKIGVRDPLSPAGTPALAVSVNDCAVVTSGGYERFKVVDGKRYSHFFDPKTGESVMSDVLSATLVTPDGSLADGLATAFMISGVDKAAGMLAKISPMPGAIFIREGQDKQLEIIATENLKDSVIMARYPVKFINPHRL